MKKKPLVFKLVFITLPALFLTLLMAEVALRVGGNIYLSTQSRFAEETSRKNSIRILCLRDSFTFGLGVPPGKSYPAQLQEILEENGHDSVTVYNGGVPAFNSSLVANKLNENINKYNPDFITIMMGHANEWNLEDSSYFLLNKIGPNSSDYFERILSKIRIYKLI